MSARYLLADSSRRLALDPPRRAGEGNLIRRAERTRAEIDRHFGLALEVYAALQSERAAATR